MDATNNDNATSESAPRFEEARCTGELRLCDNPGLRFRRIGHTRMEHRTFWVYGVSRIR